MKSKYYQMIEEYISSGKLTSSNIHKAFEHLDHILCEFEGKNEDRYEFILKKIHQEFYGCHFNECFAKAQVSKMFHKLPNVRGEHSKSIGEKFCIETAKNVYEANKHRMSQHINCYDVYVAINAQYHDNINLYNVWFPELGESLIVEKVIESAICNWFMDDDYSDNKIWNYFICQEYNKI